MGATMNIQMTDKIVSNRHGYDVKIRGRFMVMVRFRVYVMNVFCRSNGDIPGILRISHQAIPHYTRVNFKNRTLV